MSVLIFDRDFDRHRAVCDDAETGSGGQDQESNDEFLHGRIVPHVTRTGSQNRIGVSVGASVCSGP